MPALERIDGTRIAATSVAIDRAVWPPGALVLRLAPDEVFVDMAIDDAAIGDPHAIVVRETGYSGVWIDEPAALEFLQCECDWELPRERPAFGQGLVAGLPVKVWFETHRVRLIVASPFADDLMERLR